MEPRLTFITLGVRDLPGMKAWYARHFGWKPYNDEDGIAFFRLNGIILALYPEHELAADIGIKAEGSGFKRFTCSVNFRSEKEVDQITEKLRAGGVPIVRKPEKVFWGGYRGYIADPEGNYWELAYNPYLEMDEGGNVVM